MTQSLSSAFLRTSLQVIVASQHELYARLDKSNPYADYRCRRSESISRHFTFVLITAEQEAAGPTVQRYGEERGKAARSAPPLPPVTVTAAPPDVHQVLKYSQFQCNYYFCGFRCEANHSQVSQLPHK